MENYRKSENTSFDLSNFPYIGMTLCGVGMWRREKMVEWKIELKKELEEELKKELKILKAELKEELRKELCLRVYEDENEDIPFVQIECGK